MTQPTRHRDCVPDGPSSERGFVLVGVVMFVLALTILAVSLFSLSGYEAQFLKSSQDDARAFYTAAGGIERTRYVLSAKDGSIAEAKLNLPPGVVYANVIHQVDGDSGRAVSWSDPTDTAITIRVIARQGAESRELEATYVPTFNHTLYRDILATTGALAVSDVANQRRSIHVYGSIHTNNPDISSWIDEFPAPQDYTFRSGGVPVPEVQDFVNAWLPQAMGAPLYDASGYVHTYSFDLGGNDKRVYIGAPPGAGMSADSSFGLADLGGSDVSFDITGASGTVVWLLPLGAHFEQPVTVTGAAGTRLVIAAVAQVDSRGSDSTYSSLTHANLGLWFEGGIRSDVVKLFLVSNGVVALDRRTGDNNPAWNTDCLALFAGGIYLRGPIGGRTMQFGANGLDAATLDPMYDQGLLPNTLGRTKAFTLIPGSWKDLSNGN